MGPKHEHYTTFSINRPDQQSISLSQKSNLSDTIATLATLKGFNSFCSNTVQQTFFLCVFSWKHFNLHLNYFLCVDTSYIIGTLLNPLFYGTWMGSHLTSRDLFGHPDWTILWKFKRILMTSGGTNWTQLYLLSNQSRTVSLPRGWIQEIKRMYPVLLMHGLFFT
jgi:hypothetical protein